MRFAIVDIETTGIHLSQDRIIEIGVIIVEGQKIEKTFTTLINPKQYIPKEISELTGISTQDVADAPEFKDIADELIILLKDCIFVAHNAAFDYAFIQGEFERIGITFHEKTLCTVRLSRKLFPQHPRHSLSHIIDRFKITTEARHRALADAQAVWDFLQILPQHFSNEVIEDATKEIIKTQRIPPQLTEKLIKDLPKKPGVYIFYDQHNAPLYIGKSINIHERVRQHLQNSSHSNKELNIFTSLARIEAIETAGELGALLLESTLIKERFPLYNRKLRKTKKVFMLRRQISPENYFIIKGEYVESINTDDITDIMGVFVSKQQAEKFLLFVAQRYKLCHKLLQLEKGSGPCFQYHLKKCHGGCVEKEPAEAYNARFLQAFNNTRIAQWPHEGSITIEERSEDGKLVEQITIDQWCIIDRKNNSNQPIKQKFSMDDYKIIYSYMKQKSI